MKRYWLFETYQYYPRGGMLDWVGDYDTIEEAEQARTVTFNTTLANRNIEKEYEEIMDTVPTDKVHEVKLEYRKLARKVSQENLKMDTGYHILDILERKIVQGWNQYDKEEMAEKVL